MSPFFWCRFLDKPDDGVYIRMIDANGYCIHNGCWEEGIACGVFGALLDRILSLPLSDKERNYRDGVGAVSEREARSLPSSSATYQVHAILST